MIDYACSPAFLNGRGTRTEYYLTQGWRKSEAFREISELMLLKEIFLGHPQFSWKLFLLGGLWVSLGAAIATAQTSSVPLGSEIHFNPPPLPPNLNNPLSNHHQSSCSETAKTISATAILPHQFGGLTLQESPIVFVRGDLSQNNLPQSTLPETSLAKTPEIKALLKLERNGLREVETPIQLSLTSLPDYLEIDLSKANIRLEREALYRWEITFACPNSSRSHSVSGWIQTVTPPPTLTETIAQATLLQKLQLYSQYGLWYDALQAATAIAKTGDFIPLKQLQHSSFIPIDPPIQMEPKNKVLSDL